jgi:hypothetical protein
MTEAGERSLKRRRGEQVKAKLSLELSLSTPASRWGYFHFEKAGFIYWKPKYEINIPAKFSVQIQTKSTF